jgi:hypothetical protein
MKVRFVSPAEPPAEGRTLLSTLFSNDCIYPSQTEVITGPGWQQRRSAIGQKQTNSEHEKPRRSGVVLRAFGSFYAAVLLRCRL